ncbi:hypothetical protein [Companilactobacillus musae]|uniref:hypothetical protein n=1 Tax=Companilactobacillus musae TaxID=1903258 RepID=UPI000E651FB6|nr:hypothetical protein [Companilactobacillus musae]
MNKKIKYLGITAAMLLITAPISVPIIGYADGETIVQADANQDNYLDFNDPYGGILTSLSFGVNVDGGKKIVSTDIVNAKNVGDIDTQETPEVKGYVPSQDTISIQRTATGYRILQVPTYTKVDPESAPETAIVTMHKEVVRVVNKNGDLYVPLVGFSTTDGKIFDITNRALSNGTPWYSDQVKKYAGVTYYRVATNEWVESSYLFSKTDI